MRFFHLADLHIGKTVNGFSMLEDQEWIFAQINQLLRQHRPDAIVIAGDIFDRLTPTIQAVRLYDSFLMGLFSEGVPILMIAGNHDSPERLGCSGGILEHSHVYICGKSDGQTYRVTFPSASETVDFHLLPFVKPQHVQKLYPRQKVMNHQDAVSIVLQNSEIDLSRRNVLVAHQFVCFQNTWPETSDSEYPSVGGLDAVDARLFGAFDYVALGHLHKQQKIGRESVCYAGSPLKYSFSERDYRKSITLVDISGQEAPVITHLPLQPLRDMRQITGRLEDILASAQKSDDYLRIVLTDELEIPDAVRKLRAQYPNIMELRYSQKKAPDRSDFSRGPQLENKTPTDLFADFYREQNGQSPSASQMNLIENLWEDL